MAYIAGLQYSGVPVGTIMSFSGANAPPRTLLCNGDTVPNGIGTVQGITANFSALFAVLGSTYGAAGRLPDTRNVFLRGANASTRVISGITYPAVTRGATTTDEFKSHNHLPEGGVGNYFIQNGGGTGGNYNWVGGGPVFQRGVQTTSTGGAETRPVNLGVNYCIAF